MIQFNEREKDVIDTALFHLLLYVRKHPDSEYVAESNGFNEGEYDYNFSEREIESLYKRLAHAK